MSCFTLTSARPSRTRALITVAAVLLAVLVGAAGRSTAVTSAGRPVSIAASSTGHGYWIAASDGGVFAFGDAGFFGSMGGKPLNAPVAAIASTPTGRGYWLTATDGGIFAFGDAGFFGSMGGKPLNAPVAAIASTPTGRGYWLTATDGGIFAFGDAGFFGSMGGKPLNAPVSGIARTGTGLGYRLVARDGGLFAFGDAVSYGSLAGEALGGPIVGLATNPGGGYWMLGADGGVFAFGQAQYLGRVVYSGAAPGGQPVPVSRGYALVVPRSSVNAAMLSKPHHDYPAADIPVGVGTAAYAITSGTLLSIDQSGGCGWGYQLNGDDGVIYRYCHLSQRAVGSGSRVSAGAQLGLSGGKQGAPGAGSSTGPHLHLQANVGGKLRCPQPLLLALYNGTAVPAPSSLPTSGCIS
jgi:hypothetical protein